jgi:methionine-rich copper-binding protein CopC
VRAHAILLESSPADGAVLAEAPPYVSLRYNSRLEKSLSQVVLISEDGRRIHLPNNSPQKDASPGELRIPLPRLPRGAYILRFTVVAADGHTTAGVVRFRIATPR